MQKIITRIERQISLLEEKKKTEKDNIEKRIITEQINAFHFSILIINQGRL